MVRRIIIDTDPGQDDAVAILLALASPEELDVLGIVAVAGNVPLALTEKNARRIVELAGRREVPVYAGCERPMVRTLRHRRACARRTGLDGSDLARADPATRGNTASISSSTRSWRRRKATITLCTLGPLTNVAMALVKQPAIAGRLREIVMMGGAYFEVGNITPAAEFNIYVDPEAADVVFRSGIPITVAPLDVTHKVLHTEARRQAFARHRQPHGRGGRRHALLLRALRSAEIRRRSARRCTTPASSRWLLKPELFDGRQINVAIETASELTRGMTVADWWRVTDRPANALFLGEADADGYYALLTERLARLP